MARTGGTKASARAQTEPQQDHGAGVELGETGVKRWGGIIDDEYLPELRGARGRKIIREMLDHPIVSAAFGTIKQYVKATPITVQDGDDDKCNILVRECMDDMMHPFDDLMVEQLSCLGWGYSLFEIVTGLRRHDFAIERTRERTGQQVRIAAPSQFNDGLVRWLKFAPRSQESFLRWELAGGHVVGWTQTPAPDYRERTIDADRFLLFQAEPYKGSPESRAPLRGAYIPWYCEKKLRIIEGIGIERELNGIPILRAPMSVVSKSATGNELSLQRELMAIGRGIRSDDQSYVFLPGATDKEGKYLYDISLLSTQGRRAIDVGPVVQRYQRDIALALMCDFLLIGHEKVGSLALFDGKSSVFDLAVRGWIESALDVINRHAIPRLLAANGWRPQKPPKLVATTSKAPDLLTIGQYLQSLYTSGLNVFPSADGAAEKWALDQVGMPLPQVDGETVTGKRIRYESEDRHGDLVVAKALLEELREHRRMTREFDRQMKAAA